MKANSIHTTQDHRNAWLTVNLLLFASAMIFLLSSCMTYEKAVKKFGHMAKDTTHLTITDTVMVPKDSVVTSFRTDTTPLHQEAKQGRARLIIDRTPLKTTVKAVCDPDTIYKQTQVIIPPRVTFGVANWYQPAFWIVLAILGMITMIVAFFAKAVYNNLRRPHADD